MRIFTPKLYCSIFGHQYVMTKKVTAHIKEYQCSCCKKEMTIDSKGRFVPLTEKLKFMHIGIENVIQRRKNRKRITASKVA